MKQLYSGYYKKKSNEIVEVSDCILASDKINNVISVLSDNRKNNNLIEEIKKENISEIIIRDVEEGIAIYPRINSLEEILKNRNISIVHSKYTNRIGETKYIIGEKSFFQVNKYNTEKLYNKIYEYVEKIIEEQEKELKEDKKETTNNDNVDNIRILDIYSGVRKYRNIC